MAIKDGGQRVRLIDRKSRVFLECTEEELLDAGNSCYDDFVVTELSFSEGILILHVKKMSM